MADLSDLPQKCESYPPNDSTANAGNMAAGVLDSIGGSQGCDLEQNSFSIGGKVAGPFGLASAAFAAQSNNLKKSGCQTINAVVGNYLNSVYEARCIIQNDTFSSKQIVEINQQMFLNASGAGSVIENKNCPGGMRANLNATMKVTSISSISKSSSDQIARVVSQGMENTASQLQKINEGFQATGSGSTQLSDINSTIRQELNDNSINNTISEAISKYVINQTINAQALAGGKLINVMPCEWNATALMDMQLANVVSSAYSTSTTNAISAFLKSAQAQEQVVITEGAPNAVMAMFSDNMTSIIGVIVLLALAFGVYKFMGNKPGDKLGNKPGDKPGDKPGGAFGNLAGLSKGIKMKFKRNKY